MKTLILVLLGIGVVITTAKASESRDAVKADIVRYEDELSSLRERLTLCQTRDRLRDQLAKLRSDRDILANEYKSTAQKLTDLENQARRRKVIAEREGAKGEKHDSIQTKAGKVYEGVTIQKVSDVGLSILHSAGTARIAADDLPDSLQNRFEFDEGNASAQLSAEQEAMRADLEAMARKGDDRPNKGSNPTTKPQGEKEVDPGDDSKPKGWVTARVVGTRKGAKQVEFTVLSNCPATLRVSPTRDGKPPYVASFGITAKSPFKRLVWMQAKYTATLTAASGEVLDNEDSGRKTGLGDIDLK